MKTQIIAAAAVTLSAASAQAGGLDRSGQNIGVLFEEGNVVEFSLGFSSPSVDGTDTFAAPGTQTGNVTDNFLIWSTALKYDIDDQWSLALVIDEPYGLDLRYPGDGAATSLGGTAAVVDSSAVTAIVRYKFNDRFSVHGGLRYQTLSANVTLSGLAFGGLNGYNAAFDSSGAWGYVLGAAYEIPDIALRVALTYNSAITHDLDTTETVGGVPVAPTSVTEIEAPESFNLSFQSGIAANTLLFGSIRYALYEDTITSPTFFDSQIAGPNSSLTDIDQGLDLEIGVARRFNDKWAGRVAVGYQRSGEDNLVSPLAPTDGARYISVGGAYTINEKMTLSGGIRYTDLGDAFPETGTPDVARASFSGNSALSVGLKLAVKF
ncbi:MAG: outer membrane protein transport protein [Paracoccaceae bacterium]